MHDLGAFREFGDLAGHPVIKSRAGSYEQIRGEDGFVGIAGSMHARHAQGKWILAREDAVGDQGVGDWQGHFPHQPMDGVAGVGDDRAAAHEEHRALGGAQQRD